MIFRRRPALSLVVVFHDMAREAPRTLLSLSPAYQRGIAAADYEVIAVDNGSQPPLARGLLAELGLPGRVIRMAPAQPSPAAAINRGLAAARGRLVGVMIDGARLASPGLLAAARAAAAAVPEAVVLTLGWYLGSDLQSLAAPGAREREDRLLADIGWPADGYRLFEIATPDESSVEGWLRPVSESNALFQPRAAWAALGGYDERFDLPGGGLVNLDTLDRALARPGARPVLLLAEGTFHQWHGGIATNAPAAEFAQRWRLWASQYEAIRGRPYRGPDQGQRPLLFGELPPVLRPHLAKALVQPIKPPAPLGADFSTTTWSRPLAPPPPPLDGLLALAGAELQAGRQASAALVLRRLLQLRPDDAAAMALLRLVAAAAPRQKQPGPDELVALGRAAQLLGERAEAEAQFRAALALAPGLNAAYVGLAQARLPGWDYHRWLSRLHAVLRPRLYVEVGVAKGATLALARPGCRAVGIDPKLKLEARLQTETHLFAETSDAFFGRDGLAGLAGEEPLGLGFVDGLHEFGQALRDVLHLEAYCGPRSLLTLHDTLPLDEPTQRAERQYNFYTGDIWKVVLCLRALRPDLTILTVPAFPSGLTLVWGFGPPTRQPRQLPDAAVARYASLDYAAQEPTLAADLGLVANHWPPVAARLRQAGVLSERTDALDETVAGD